MMDKILDFLAMGGYATYVWPSYGLALLVLVWILVASLRQQRAARLEVRRWVETHASRGDRS